MATLKTFRFDTDLDDVQLMEKIVQEENEKVEDGNTLLEPEPEIVAPTYSEDDLEAARQEGFNAGKENGIKETLAGIENIISQTLNSIVIGMSEFCQRQTEFKARDAADRNAEPRCGRTLWLAVKSLPTGCFRSIFAFLPRSRPFLTFLPRLLSLPFRARYISL